MQLQTYEKIMRIPFRRLYKITKTELKDEKLQIF